MRSTLAGKTFLVSAVLPLLFAALATIHAQQAAAPSFEERWKDVPPLIQPQTSPSLEKIATAQIKNALPVKLDQALYLIRSTLLTLNDANRSGNYSVLRDLAAPSFQAKNTAADLAQIFSNLRSQRFDLFAVAILAPELTTPPHFENNGLLRLTGHFPTRPLQINFDLLFENVANEWRLFGISVATPQARPVATAKGSGQTPKK